MSKEEPSRLCSRSFSLVQQHQPRDGVHRHVLCVQLSLIFGLVKVTHRLYFHLSYMVFLCRFLPHLAKLWEFAGVTIKHRTKNWVLGKQDRVTVQFLTTFLIEWKKVSEYFWLFNNFQAIFKYLSNFLLSLFPLPGCTTDLREAYYKD